MSKRIERYLEALRRIKVPGLIVHIERKDPAQGVVELTIELSDGNSTRGS